MILQKIEFSDRLLGGFLMRMPQYAQRADENLGKHRVPTLRNLDLRPYPEFVKAYGHNGYFKSIKDIVHFYNTRDVLSACAGHKDPQPNVNCWPAPEVVPNINREELGKLELSEAEEQAIVAFLKTLNDGWTPDTSKHSASSSP
jgi:cytochrome c peroxidase